MPQQHSTRPPAGVPSMMYLIKQVELAAKGHLDQLVAPFGVTGVQYTALTVLARNPGMTSARLARNSFVRIQSMAQTIAGLEERGWIVREADPSSRRQRRISLTESGRALIHSLQEPLEALEHDMFADFEGEEVEAFAEYLQRLRLRLGGSHPH